MRSCQAFQELDILETVQGALFHSMWEHSVQETQGVHFILGRAEWIGMPPSPGEGRNKAIRNKGILSAKKKDKTIS